MKRGVHVMAVTTAGVAPPAICKVQRHFGRQAVRSYDERNARLESRSTLAADGELRNGNQSGTTGFLCQGHQSTTPAPSATDITRTTSNAEALIHAIAGTLRAITSPRRQICQEATW